MGWSADIQKDFSCSQPVLIEGLPGIGNVGKIVVDYLIDTCNAKKIASFFSYDLPNSVFVEESGQVALPKIELYYLRKDNQDFLLLAGDAQPSQERASYELTQEILSLVSSFSCSSIITLGGIGLPEEPSNPQVFITGNDPDFIETFSSFQLNKNVYGTVGPIVGVSGLLLGLSQKKKIPAVALLGETFAHPMYIGLHEARQTLQILDKKFNLQIDFSDLDQEIRLVQEDADGASKNKKGSSKFAQKLPVQDTSYIG